MPKSMRLFFVSILILCCCVSVAFAIEQPQKNDHARNLDQLIITHHQDRNRDGSCDGDQDRDQDRNRDGSCQSNLTDPNGQTIIADDQDRDQDQDRNRDGSCQPILTNPNGRTIIADDQDRDQDQDRDRDGSC